MEVKERIKQKADELFRQYGIKTITMDEIAGKLGISKKTIYLAYADKDELVDDVISDLISYNQHRCTKDRAASKDAIHEIFLAMEMVQAMFENMNPVILYDMERNHPRTYQKFLEHKYKFLFQVITQNIERGKKEELYRQDVNTEVMARARLEMIMLPFNQQIFPKSKFNLVDLEKELMQHFLFGIATSRGNKLIQKYRQRTKKEVNEKKK